MRLLYFLVAEDFIVDQFRNAATAVKIVERLALRESNPAIPGSRGFDWRPFRFCALAVFQAGSDEEPRSEFSVHLRTPTREVDLGRRPCDFAGRRVSRSRMEFPGVPDDGPGEYAVLIRYRGDQGEASAEWGFEVQLVAPVATEGATSDAASPARAQRP